MNRIIVTYTPQFIIVRFFAGADADASLTRVVEHLLASAYVIAIPDYTNLVLGNSNAYYILFTRPAAIPALVPAVIDNVTWVDAVTADPAAVAEINSVIVTYGLQAAIVRFFGGSDNDVALALAGNTLVNATLVLGTAWRNTVIDSDLRAFLVFTRAVAGDRIVPTEGDNLVWVDVSP